MPTRITLSAKQKAELAKATGLKVDHLDVGDKVLITLTDEQRAHIKERTGKAIAHLELTEFDLKKLTKPAAYENGLTVTIGKK
jgi:hypothetical protein